MIRIDCTSCGTGFSVDERFRGRRGRCPNPACRQEYVVGATVDPQPPHSGIPLIVPPPAPLVRKRRSLGSHQETIGLVVIVLVVAVSTMVMVKWLSTPAQVTSPVRSIANVLPAASLPTHAEPSKAAAGDMAEPVAKRSEDASPPTGESVKQPPLPDALFAAASPAVVQIEMLDGSGQGLAQGSGFFIDSRGTLVTNFHVIAVEGAVRARIRLPNNSMYETTRAEAVSPERDLGILRVDGKDLPRLKLREEPSKIGERVFAIGNPQGFRNTFSEGLVSGIRGEGDNEFVQTTVAISPGSSGGPLVDAFGRVVGVTTLTFRLGQSMNFAVPTSAILSLLSSDRAPQELQVVAQSASREAKLPPELAASTGAPRSKFVHGEDVLKGLKGVAVVVEELHSDASYAALSTHALKKRVEGTLEDAGVPILTESARREDAAAPYLYLQVSTISPPGRTVFGWIMDLRLMERAILIRSDNGSLQLTHAATWKAVGQFGSAPTRETARAVNSAVDGAVKQFVREYLAVNP